MKEWILSAHYAEKLAPSDDFDEIKSFAEKIGTNRRLLNRKIFFDFVSPFDLIPKYKEICEASGQTNSPKNDKSLIWSGREDSNLRPHEPESCVLATELLPVNDEVRLVRILIFCQKPTLLVGFLELLD